MSVALASLEDEQAVMGCMLVSATALDNALAQLRPEDFERDTNRVLFEELARMRRSGEAIDEQTAVGWLKHAKRLKDAGGAQTVMTLADRVPAVANHQAYIREVRDLSILRSVVKAAQRMADAATTPDLSQHRVDATDHPAKAMLEEATATLIDLRERVERRTYAKKSDLGSILDEWMGRYVTEQGDPDASLAIPFPAHLPQLNDWTMGQRPGRLIVSAGGTGHGKSWFGLDCTETALMQGARVAYFSLELPGEEILERLIAMGGTSYAAIQERTAEWDSMHDRINEIDALRNHLTVLDGTTTYKRIESEIIAARVAGRPYRYVVVDTANQVELPGRAQDQTNELEKLYRRFKNLALDHRLTLHIQAQLTHEWHKKPGQDAPTQGDLKGGSMIAQNADLLLFVHRFPGVQASTLSDGGEIVVAKGRNLRRRGPIPVVFDPAGLRFRDPKCMPFYAGGAVA